MQCTIPWKWNKNSFMSNVRENPSILNHSMRTVSVRENRGGKKECLSLLPFICEFIEEEKKPHTIYSSLVSKSSFSSNQRHLEMKVELCSKPQSYIKGNKNWPRMLITLSILKRKKARVLLFELHTSAISGTKVELVIASMLCSKPQSHLFSVCSKLQS